MKILMAHIFNNVVDSNTKWSCVDSNTKWSCDDRYIILDSFSNLLVKIDSEDGTLSKHVAQISSSSLAVSRAFWLPDGRRSFVFLYDGQAIIFDTVLCRELGTVNIGPGSFLQNNGTDIVGSIIAVPDDSGRLSLWNIDTFGVMCTIDCPAKSIVKPYFSSSGEFLAVVSVNEPVKIWHVPSGSCVAVLNVGSGAVRTLSWSPDSKTVVVATASGQISFWDVAGGVKSIELFNRVGAVFSTDWSSDGRYVLLTQGGHIFLFDCTSGVLREILKTVVGFAVGASFNSRCDSVAVQYAGRYVTVFCLRHIYGQDKDRVI